MHGSTLIVGAGPAGLAAGRELVLADADVTILEQSEQVGGICTTVEHDGFRFDIGGHRFFTRIDEVARVWDELMGDDFLVRERLSRIFFRGRLLDYPLSIGSTLRALGVIDSLLAMGSYLWARLCPGPDDTFEGWVTSRFGHRLYARFFRTYTEKVWGMPCAEISADWAAQRIRSLSLWRAVRDAVMRRGEREAISLLRQFRYPRLGPGQLYGRCRDQITGAGGRVLSGQRAVRVRVEDGRVRHVLAETAGGEVKHEAEHYLSSMPLADLALSVDPPPDDEVVDAARGLRHRGFLTAGLIVNQPDPFPDQWIYVHEPTVRVGRVQNYRNWSPHMVPDEDMCSIGAEYFAWTDDPVWSEPDEAIIDLARRELDRLGLVDASAVVGGTVMRVPDAYPVYDRGYRERVATIRAWLEGVDNLQTIGRGGQHRYNNMDHSMLTGMLAARNILGGSHDVWDVNVEEEHVERR